MRLNELIHSLLARGVELRVATSGRLQFRADKQLVPSMMERELLRDFQAEVIWILSQSGIGGLTVSPTVRSASHPNLITDAEWDNWADDLESALLPVEGTLSAQHFKPSQIESARQLMEDARAMLREAIDRNNREAAGRAVGYAKHLAHCLPLYLARHRRVDNGPSCDATPSDDLDCRRPHRADRAA